MAKLRFHWRNGKMVVPTDAERIADALAEVRAGLEHIKDPRVWGGYPDDWPDNADDEPEPGAPVGMVLNLERFTRGNPTWQMAMAIDVAFALGKIARGDELDLKNAAKLRVYESGLLKGNRHRATKRGKKAADWHDKAESLALQELEQNPRLGLKALKRTAWERVRIKRPNGKWFPAEVSVGDVLKERLKGKLARSHKQPQGKRPI